MQVRSRSLNADNQNSAVFFLFSFSFLMIRETETERDNGGGGGGERERQTERDLHAGTELLYIHTTDNQDERESQACWEIIIYIYLYACFIILTDMPTQAVHMHIFQHLKKSLTTCSNGLSNKVLTITLCSMQWDCLGGILTRPIPTCDTLNGR